MQLKTDFVFVSSPNRFFKKISRSIFLSPQSSRLATMLHVYAIKNRKANMKQGKTFSISENRNQINLHGKWKHIMEIWAAAENEKFISIALHVFIAWRKSILWNLGEKTKKKRDRKM